SELTAGLAAVCTGSDELIAADRTDGVAGCGIAGGSDTAALPFATSATETPCSPSAVARDASTYLVWAAADVAGPTSIRASVPSMPSEPRPASPAPTQPPRAPIPNAANTASRRTPRPSQVSPRSNGGFQSSVDDDCYRPN